MDCILQFWNVIWNMHRLLKINEDFQKKSLQETTNPKLQGVFHNIGRVRDSEHYKK